MIHGSTSLVHSPRNGAQDPTIAVNSVVALALAFSGQNLSVHLAKRDASCELLQQAGLRRGSTRSGFNHRSGKAS